MAVRQILEVHGFDEATLVLADRGGMPPIDSSLAAALCDKRTGLGADRLLHVAPARAPRRGPAQITLFKWFARSYAATPVSSPRLYALRILNL